MDPVALSDGSRERQEPRVSAPRQVAAAYDALAPEYESVTSEDGWMREVLRRRALALFPPGGYLLDFGCGTGLDTLFLAEHGFRVSAADVSPGMLEPLRRRLAAHPARDRVAVHVADVGALAEFAPGGFDGIFSAFAGLNTSDLEAFAGQASRLLRPGGRLLAHLLAPAGIWERRKARRLEGPAAARALGRRRCRTVEISGRPVRHWVLPPRAALAHFLPGFRCLRLYGLGIFWERDFGHRVPPSLALGLGRLETWLGRLAPFRGWGRFYVLELERRP